MSNSFIPPIHRSSFSALARFLRLRRQQDETTLISNTMSGGGAKLTPIKEVLARAREPQSSD